MQDERAIVEQKTDAVVTLGGDGTILHAASLFSKTQMPPVLSFALGTLGFLLPFGMLWPSVHVLTWGRF